MEMRKPRDRRATSPVIATVILVAVAITIAVAVSYWMGGITGQYTRFEKLEVTSVYCESTTGDWSVSQEAWNITLNLRNTGTTEATIIGAFINAKAIADFGGSSIVPLELDNVRAYKDPISTTNQLDFAESSTSHDIKMTVVPGESGKIYISMRQTPVSPADAYAFSSGTTIEVSLQTGAGNTYMKMVTLS